MIKTMKKAIAFVLMICTLITTASSCSLFSSNNEVKDGEIYSNGIFPKGYTGGFLISPGSSVEYWWVETNEEALAAIELLKSHGSTFSDDVAILTESDLFDVKYCFTIVGNGSKGDKIKFGDNPFDRWAQGIRVRSYAFFEPVTLDELNYSLIGRYDAYEFGIYNSYSKSFDEVTTENIQISEWTKTDNTNLYKWHNIQFYAIYIN